jgi:methyl-accepting chemotaxis protein
MSNSNNSASGRGMGGFGEFFRYHGWLAPGVRLFRSISFPAKASWISAAFGVPLVASMSFLWSSAHEQIAFAGSERQGLTYVRPLVELIKVSQWRRVGAVVSAADMAERQDKVKAAFEVVKAKHDEFSKAFQEDKQYAAFLQAHLALLQTPTAATPDATFKVHSDYIEAILDLVNQVANGSALSLDPDLDTFNMMYMSVMRGPIQYENLAQLRGMGALILKSRENTAQRHEWMIKATSVLALLDKDVEGAYQAGIGNDPEVAKLFDMPGTDAATEAFVRAVHTQVLGPELAGDAGSYLSLGNEAVDKQIELTKKVMERLDSQLQHRIDRLWRTLLSQVTFAVLFVGLAGYFMLAFYKVMMGGLREVSGHLQAITKGNLSTAPKPWGNDEAAQLMVTMGEMQSSLRRIVQVVLDGAANVQMASGEIASASMNLSQRTEQNAASLQQTSASMEHISEGMRQSFTTVEIATRSAHANAAAANRGGEAIAEVVSTMQGIRASSAKISEIIGVIDGIAFQTNILALNAAVEAARAGDQGRGFAVVATEVRALAGRSAQAAKEIKTLIGSSIDQVESGADVVAKAGTSMTDVVDSAAQISKLMSEIASGTRVQTHGVGEVSSAVRQLDESTQQNAALVEQTAAASGSLADQAQRLSSEVAFFRLV